MLADRVRSLIRRNEQRLERLLATGSRPEDRIELYRRDPVRFFTASGLAADPWQVNAIHSTAKRSLWLCCRQFAGKSTTAARIALKETIPVPGATVLLVSPSLRQSGELFRRTMTAFNDIGRPVGVRAESALRVEFDNGSRIVSLPATESNIRGYTANAVIIDESARVVDPLYFAIRPMLATTGGRLICLSTAFAKSGFFYEAWTGEEQWERVRVPASQCPRADQEFLASERLALGARWYQMEYECEFGDDVAAVFSVDDIRAARAAGAGVLPLFPATAAPASAIDRTVRPLFGSTT